MNKLYVGLLISILFMVVSCKKETTAPPPVEEAKQADVEVLEPMLLEDGGVRLSIKVNSVPADLIYAYDIIVSKDSLFRDMPITRDFELPMRVKTYHYDLLSGLEQDAVYYYTYRINYMLQIPQSKQSFTFGKESKVVIDSISPRQAAIGDTLRVYGKFKDYTFTKGSLGDSVMNIIRKAENLVEIPLDQKTPQGKVNVSLSTNYQRIVADSLFTLVTPRILSFPDEAGIGDEIIIQGQNFSPTAGQNKVFLNDVEVAVNSFSRTYLAVTIPNSIKSASIRVAVQSQKQVVSSDKVLNIRTPKIIAVPKDMRISSYYTLQFEDLPNIPLEIRLDEQLISIDYRSDQGGLNNLLVTAPIAAYPNKKPRLTLKYLDQTIVLREVINVLDQWDFIATSVPFDETNVRGTFTIGGVTYVVALAKDYFDQPIYYIWKFNSSNNTFTSIEIPYATDFPTVACSGTDIYLYTAKTGENFYRYSTVGNTWKKLASYPSQPRRGGVMNSVHSNLYITTGQNDGEFWNVVEDNTLYRYSIQHNQWDQMDASYPTLTDVLYDNRINGTSMVIGDEFYVLGGGRTTGNVEVFAFNTLTNSWSRKADYDAVMYASTLVKDSYGWVISSSTFKRYDARSNTWSSLSEYLLPSIGGMQDYRYAFFNVGSHVYVVYGGLFFKMKLTDILP